MRHLSYLSALLSASACLAARSPSAQQWAERSIYQVMTDRFARPAGSPDELCNPYNYCGGTWSGIIDKLDYIQDLGFTAVQIFPVVENIPDDTLYGEAYHGYWPQNMYALNEYFGTADELRRLSKELHKRGMYLMVDVVNNDMAQAVNGSTTDEDGPEINWSKLNDPDTSKKCWSSMEVVALPDLKTEDQKGLVGNYSIDGLRVDATKQMDDAYLTSFSKAAGVFTMGEVYAKNTKAVCRYQGFVSGLLNYPLHGPMVQAFTAGNMPGLAAKVKDVQSECKDFTRLGTFMENHDTPRFASLHNDTTLAKNAMAFIILSDGIPIGQEQHMTGSSTPYNRSPFWETNYNKQHPLYNTTATLNKPRNHAIRMDRRHVTKHSKELYVDGSVYTTRKGTQGSQVVSVFSNQGEHGAAYNLTIPGSFAPDTKVVEVLSCQKTIMDREGKLTVHMDGGEPKVFFPERKMDGLGLCGFKKRKGPVLGCSGTETITKGNGTHTTVKTGSVGGDTFDQDSSGRGVSVPYTMALLGAFAGVGI
ncbi:alpha-amylase [Aspergillus undulatus]|uniref:alpha-amylase n=1 Tax=Aspergillus undulatus TaxID=1810928 RepID=UPI003CCDF672